MAATRLDSRALMAAKIDRASASPPAPATPSLSALLHADQGASVLSEARTSDRSTPSPRAAAAEPSLDEPRRIPDFLLSMRRSSNVALTRTKIAQGESFAKGPEGMLSAGGPSEADLRGQAPSGAHNSAPGPDQFPCNAWSGVEDSFDLLEGVAWDVFESGHDRSLSRIITPKWPEPDDLVFCVRGAGAPCPIARANTGAKTISPAINHQVAKQALDERLFNEVESFMSVAVLQWEGAPIKGARKHAGFELCPEAEFIVQRRFLVINPQPIDTPARLHSYFEVRVGIALREPRQHIHGTVFERLALGPAKSYTGEGTERSMVAADRSIVLAHYHYLEMKRIGSTAEHDKLRIGEREQYPCTPSAVDGPSLSGPVRAHRPMVAVSSTCSSLSLADPYRRSPTRPWHCASTWPLLGYGSNFELLQFVYDLNLWATLGAKKNLGLDNAPMRMLMKGHTFSPLYWKEVHNALVDLVRQVGFPKLFFTIAPWEPCFKYHDWLRDEMEKTLRTRMYLPVGETLHMSHVLMQIVRGMLAGNNYQMMDRSNRSWTQHVFAAKDADGRQVRVQSFTRLEFQDGSRKEGTKRYDGSGRPHLHVLFFADDDSMANMGLEHHLFATQPDGFSDDLKGYVDGSQFNKHGDAESKWPIYHGPSGVHGDDGVLQLKHTREDHDAGLRAYCADVMDGLPCHQDWQTSDGEAMLLQYVSKYVAKFSDSSYDEWMSDRASADSVARRVCFECHPYEPEMILQLCGAQFRQYDISTVSGGFRTATAPYSGMAEVPEWVQRHADCSWRHEGMTLMDWLRKTTDDGAIVGWLKRKHKQELALALHRRYRATVPDGEEPQALDAHWRFLRAEYKGMADADGGDGGNSDEDSDAEDVEQPKTFEEFLAKKHRDEKSEGEDDFPNLKEFARAYRMQGEKVVSVDTVYELNDRYYGQWAAMNVPFRSLDELEFEDVNRLVPQKYKYLAAALRLCSDQGRVAQEHHDLFTDDRRLMDYMSASAKSSKFSEAVHHMIVGQRKLINMYLTGIIDKADEKAAADAEAAVIGSRRPARGEGQEDVDFNPKQLQLEEAISERVDRAARAELSGDWEEADEAREEAHKKNTPVICLGKPGTGKTTVVKSCIRRAQEQGARVLFALPTAQLSSRTKQALQGLEGLTVDTCHAAFKLHDPITESLHRMTDFDLVVVDEVSLLSCESFERILKLWSVAGKVPALVFLGDKHQLPGVEPTRPWESAAWKQPRCFHVKLTETWRCKEERFQEILDELRTDKPSKETFRKIVRDHKAWKSRGDPTPAEMKKLFEKHPDTRIVTCTHRGAAAVNEAAVAALYGRKTPLATLDGDVELNPENFLDGKLRTDRRLVPSKVPIYKGMKLYLTKNKNNGGEHAEVTKHHWPSLAGPIARRATRTVGTPTIVQGDEFPHITIYLDGWPRPAAGYTALSRVATSDDYLIGGYVERDNFIPAF
ncbi:unnamed protein product [Prorocentrum cordatum]|uniref:ATP-dependent DNA helicase n=1 Tax=Prorocentrum cordatum TaxID=2364126 RepID=A0ABN9VC96_9DINO|nr:unnamed protein product [Polarella glacialis]